MISGYYTTWTQQVHAYLYSVIHRFRACATKQPNYRYQEELTGLMCQGTVQL